MTGGKVLEQKMNYIASPNYQARPVGQNVDFLIIHYTDCGLNSALKLLTDDKASHPVSAHYVIAEDGQMFQLVTEENMAWHAGQSYWAGRPALNQCSIGIELVHPGHRPPYPPYPLAQMTALLDLSQGILARHPIPPRHVLGHSDIAPQRKQDPGEFFDWGFLAQHGIGIAPQAVAEHAMQEGEDKKDIIRKLGEIGYEIPSPLTDNQLSHVICAFQRHFYPHAQLGTLCKETSRRIINLHQMLLPV
jgi:N-acetylmuramoyl-L-alanine amidase